jgi:hypothetical protein
LRRIMDIFNFLSFNMNASRTNRFILMLLLASSCVKSDYEKLEEYELARGIRKDSLFYSIKFGMKSIDYRAYCGKMNSEGIFSNGQSSSSVEFNIIGLAHDAVCSFTPQFFHDRIYQVTSTVQYRSWAPWNRYLFSDSLQLGFVELAKKWYPKGKFVKITHSKKGDAFVMIEANKRVSIFIEDDRKIKIIFRDLLVDDKMILDSLSRIK